MNTASNLDDWIGRSQTEYDAAHAGPAQRLAATLDRTDLAPRLAAPQPLPPCWHWLYFLPDAPQAALGADGHPTRGTFLPPVQLPRRMWAGSRIELLAPIAFGAPIERASTITRIENKSGRSGALVLVTVRHEIRSGGTLAVTDEHDIVYREPPAVAAPAGAPAAAGGEPPGAAAFSRTIRPDPMLLFRYSALTFNGHRIHYDRRYATEAEGYPGLVVHGPLQATLLLDLLDRNRPGARVARFAFRALAPLFDTAPFAVCGAIDGERARLWTQTPGGRVAMDATAEFA